MNHTPVDFEKGKYKENAKKCTKKDYLYQSFQKKNAKLSKFRNGENSCGCENKLVHGGEAKCVLGVDKIIRCV